MSWEAGMARLKPRINKIELALMSLAMFSFFILPLPWYIDELIKFPNILPYNQPTWVSICQNFGLLSATAGLTYHLYRQKNLKNKQNN